MSFGKTNNGSGPGNQVYPTPNFYTHHLCEDSDESASDDSCVDVRHTLRNEQKQHRKSFDAISHALCLTNCSSEILTNDSRLAYTDHVIMNAPAPRNPVQPIRKPLVKHKAYSCAQSITPEKAEIAVQRQFNSNDVLSGIYNSELEHVTVSSTPEKVHKSMEIFHSQLKMVSSEAVTMDAEEALQLSPGLLNPVVSHSAPNRKLNKLLPPMQRDFDIIDLFEDDLEMSSDMQSSSKRARTEIADSIFGPVRSHCSQLLPDIYLFEPLVPTTPLVVKSEQQITHGETAPVCLAIDSARSTKVDNVSMASKRGRKVSRKAKEQMAELTHKMDSIKIAKRSAKISKMSAPVPSSIECPLCKMQLKKSSALGGHMSKAHPRQSESYKRKMEVRENRSPERKVLAAAKEVFRSVHPELELRDHRPRIAGIKNKIKQYQQRELIDVDDLDIIIAYLIKTLMQ